MKGPHQGAPFPSKSVFIWALEELWAGCGELSPGSVQPSQVFPGELSGRSPGSLPESLRIIKTPITVGLGSLIQNTAASF